MQKIINIYNTINLDCKKSFFILILILVIRNIFSNFIKGKK